MAEVDPVTSHLDLLVRFGADGTILGLGLGSSPEEWVTTLGQDFDEASRREGHKVLSYGLVEAEFGATGAGGWSCDQIKLVIADLPSAGRPGAAVPPALREHYGDVPARVGFDQVAQAAARAGQRVCRVEKAVPTVIDRFWFPAAGVSFWVLTEHQLDDYPGHRAGDVYSANVLKDSPMSASSLTPYP